MMLSAREAESSGLWLCELLDNDSSLSGARLVAGSWGGEANQSAAPVEIPSGLRGLTIRGGSADVAGSRTVAGRNVGGIEGCGIR